MAGIHVLLDSLKGGNKLEKATTPKGKDVIVSPENAAEVFAAILSGSMNLNSNPKGQNSSLAGQDMEGTQSAGNSVQIPQKQSTKGNVLLGYGNFALPFLTQLMLQSDFPAGKEANSGSVVSQGTGGLLTADAQLTNAKAAMVDINSSLVNSGVVNSSEVPQVSDESLATTGMASPKPQGENTGITELDKYRLVISQLLEVLSGEITSPQGNPLNLGTGTEALSQDVTKLFQGDNLITQALSLEGDKARQAGGSAISNSAVAKVLSPLKGFSTNSLNLDVAKSVQGDKAQGLLAGLPKEITALASKEDTLSSGITGIEALSQDILKVVRDWKMLTSDLKGTKSLLDALGPGIKGDIVPTVQGSSDSPVKQLKGTDVDQVATQAQVKDTVFPTNVRLKPEKMDFHASQFPEQPHAVNDAQNQNASTAIGVASNTVVANVASGKTVAIPVWEQISTGFREQILNRHQELKELDIQLHPAELGKVQINLRWENGLVHLQVQASEAATGTILQNQLSDLRHTLTDQGVNCGTLQMGQGGDQRQNQRGDESRKMFNQNSNSNADEELIPDTSPFLGGQDEINRINVTA
ncbi:flagellar hook-length control protein FliK [Desulfosporosinus metallidurans]|uniref:Flagellar hook-length control protein FliK n=1 Tax=Desulfosporosinus metallidurans TaxID=1888891 RepID=A0A1Q8R1W4_9FIRM|nr:flagellar hook-length control protein FliK [Desulfosporosinus metallidurans]OLN33481.1 Flagellar hook-length control protein FliK [Desulfosporosinus metallidurans]